jgi:hypothetical protein
MLNHEDNGGQWRNTDEFGGLRQKQTMTAMGDSGRALRLGPKGKQRFSFFILPKIFSLKKQLQ